MVERLNWSCTARLATTRIVADMDRRFCIKAYTNSVILQVRLVIYRSDAFKDFVSPFCFFWTLVFATLRSLYPRRIKMSDIVRTEGSISSDQPFATKALRTESCSFIGVCKRGAKVWISLA